MQARDVMTTALVTAAPETPIEEIARLMTRNGISGVPILDADRAVVGMVSEGDLMSRVEGAEDAPRGSLARILFGEGGSTADFIRQRGRLARDIMTRNVIAVPPEMPVGEIARLVERQHIKRVPVVEDGRIVGLVSRANLLHALARAPGHPMPPDADDDALRRALLTELGKVPGIILAHVQVSVQDRKAEIRGIVASDLVARAARVAADGVEGLAALDVELGTAPDWIWGI